MHESEFANLICKDAEKKLRLICEEKAIELYGVNLDIVYGLGNEDEEK